MKTTEKLRAVILNKTTESMRIILEEGCITNSLYVDGKDIDGLTTENIQEAIMNIVATLKRDDLIYLLKELVAWFGNISSTHYCETCGDSNRDYTINVPEVWKIDLKQ